MPWCSGATRSNVDACSTLCQESAPIMASPAGFICKRRPSLATTLMHSGLVSVIARISSPLAYISPFVSEFLDGLLLPSTVYPPNPARNVAPIYTDPRRLAAAESARMRRKLLTCGATCGVLSLFCREAKVAVLGWERIANQNRRIIRKRKFYAKSNAVIGRAADTGRRFRLQQCKIAGCRG